MWETATVGDICQIRTGKKDVNTGNPDGQYPFFTCAKENTFSDEYSFDTEALLIAGNGDVGQVSYYKGKFEAYQRTYVLDKFDKILPLFLYHILQTELPIELDKQKKGTAIPYIRVGMLQAFEIPIPPLSEQEKIVEKFDKVFYDIDKTIKATEAKQKEIEALKFATLKDYFDSSKSIWEEKKLSDVCKLYQPKTISTKEFVEDGEYVVFGANGVIGKYNQYNHEFPEVTITCRGATCGTINMSEPFSWITGNAMVCSPRCNELAKDYLFYCLLNADLFSVITGTAQPQITRTSIENSSISILIPSPAEQNSIVEKFDKIFAEADKLADIYKKQIEEYNNLKSSFLRQELRSEAA